MGVAICLLWSPRKELLYPTLLPSRNELERPGPTSEMHGLYAIDLPHPM